MTSIKLILWKHDQRKDSRYPIAIRITKDRKTKYKFTGKFVSEKQWDTKKNKVKRSHENSIRLNAYLRKKLRRVEEIIDNAEITDEEISLNQIKAQTHRKTGKISFFALATERIRRYYAKGSFPVANAELSILFNIHEFITLNTAQSNKKAIEAIYQRRKDRVSKRRSGEQTSEDRLKFLSESTSLSFTEIDFAFINKFKNFCAAYLQQQPRTITNQLIFIRTVYNQAIKENLADPRKYPFGGDNERIRIKSGNKIGLTREEVSRIESLKLKAETPIWHTRNIWLFSFYFAGIRISDVLALKWNDFMDGRLYYEMNKNEKPVSLKIPHQAQNILSIYTKNKVSNSDFVFPFLKSANKSEKRDLFVKTRNATRLLNKHLKEIASICDIEKNLSNHIARHTFGNIAGDRIHPLMLQKLYRHSDLKTTINYQANFIHKEADEALDTVLNF